MRILHSSHAQVSPWIASISYIHIENSSLRELPKWLAQAKELKRIFIQGEQQKDNYEFVPSFHMRKNSKGKHMMRERIL